MKTVQVYLIIWMTLVPSSWPFIPPILLCKNTFVNFSNLKSFSISEVTKSHPEGNDDIEFSID